MIDKLLECQVAVDIGGGRDPKGSINVDINREYHPDIIGDIRFLPLRSGSLDSAVCSHVIEHLRDHMRAAEELSRILQPSGRLVLFGPNDKSLSYSILNPVYEWLYGRYISEKDSSKTHVLELSPTIIKQIMNSYFSHVEAKAFNFGMEFVAYCKKS